MRNLVVTKLTQPVEWIWSADPALAWKSESDFSSTEEWEKYQGEKRAILRRYSETNDPSVLPIVDGCKPVIWVIGKLTRAQLQILDDGKPFSNETMLGYISFGVREVKGLCYTDGTPYVLERVDTPQGKRISDECLGELFGDDRLRAEMYLRVKEAGLLTAAQRKSDPVSILDA